MTVKIDKLVWDEWNIQHVARHNVVQSEVEESLHNRFVVRPTYRERLLLIGKTNAGRLISTVVHEDNENIYYVITSRDASVSEIQDYEEETAA